MPPDITLILTPSEVLMFKDFQQYHDTFTLLCQKGVFQTKFGKVILNFADGELKTITKEEIIYHK